MHRLGAKIKEVGNYEVLQLKRGLPMCKLITFSQIHKKVGKWQVANFTGFTVQEHFILNLMKISSLPQRFRRETKHRKI
jgi:hypothetical protein